MTDFLDILAKDAKATVAEGYYETLVKSHAVSVSLQDTLARSRYLPVITELKGKSPSRGLIKEGFVPENVAKAMEEGGASGISVLTEPKHFGGSLSSLARVRSSVTLPILMKDIVVSSLQLDAAFHMGSNAVLLIQAVYDRGYGELCLAEMMDEAHSRGLEVLLETHNQDEFQRALKTNADLVGINNRNLGTLNVDLNVTKRILQGANLNGRIVVSESGIKSAHDITFLSKNGASAFLVGSEIMSANDIESKTRELTRLRKEK